MPEPAELQVGWAGQCFTSEAQDMVYKYMSLGERALCCFPKRPQQAWCLGA